MTPCKKQTRDTLYKILTGEYIKELNKFSFPRFCSFDSMLKQFLFWFHGPSCIILEALESGMCDVIKIRLDRRDGRRSGK